MFELTRLTDSDDECRLRDILRQSLRFSNDYLVTYARRIGVENFRVLRKGGRVIGGLAIYSMGQWFGGQCLDNAGIAAVGIAPEERAAGAATHLLTATLNELYEQGVPLSTLYPSTQQTYRKVGYEQAGSRYHYKLSLDSIGVKDRGASLHRIEDDEHERYHELARIRAKLTNGNLERNVAQWERIVTYPYGDSTVYRYLIGDAARPDGYLFYHQEANQHGSCDLCVRDMAAVSPAASRGLWTFFSDHRSMAESVDWFGPAADPLLLLPRECKAQLLGNLRWMLRIIDIKKALCERVYPNEVGGELHFEIEDDVVRANKGRFILSVADGCGQVRAGGRGDLRAHIRGMSPLFSSFASPSQLRALGQIEASDQAIALATSLFAGPEPWMPDMF